MVVTQLYHFVRFSSPFSVDIPTPNITSHNTIGPVSERTWHGPLNSHHGCVSDTGATFSVSSREATVDRHALIWQDLQVVQQCGRLL